MSRSYKKPIIKDGCKKTNKIFLRQQKRSQKNYLKSNIINILSDEDFILNIPDVKNIVNDYTLCDDKFYYNIPWTKSNYCDYKEFKEEQKIYSRK